MRAVPKRFPSRVCMCRYSIYLRSAFQLPFHATLIAHTSTNTQNETSMADAPQKKTGRGGEIQNQYFSPPLSSLMEPSASLSQSSCSRASSIAHAAPEPRWWPRHGSGSPSFPWDCDWPLLLILRVLGWTVWQVRQH